MKIIASLSPLLVLLAPAALFGAVHHTRAQAAYFNAHDKCVMQLRDAQKDVAPRDASERKRLVKAAKQEYRRCEAHAHLIWKYYPSPPPEDAAPVTTTTGDAATPPATTTH